MVDGGSEAATCFGGGKEPQRVSDELKGLARLREDVLLGTLNRRDVLKRGAMLGLSAPVIAGLLAACGSDDDDDDGSDDTAEPTNTTASGGAFGSDGTTTCTLG